jgi:hypothetical protein
LTIALDPKEVIILLHHRTHLLPSEKQYFKLHSFCDSYMLQLRDDVRYVDNLEDDLTEELYDVISILTHINRMITLATYEF